MSDAKKWRTAAEAIDRGSVRFTCNAAWAFGGLPDTSVHHDVLCLMEDDRQSIDPTDIKARLMLCLLLAAMTDIERREVLYD